MAVANYVPGDEGITHASNIMNSQDINSLFCKCDRNANRSRFSLLDGTAEDLRQKSLARMSDEHWTLQVPLQVRH